MADNDNSTSLYDEYDARVGRILVWAANLEERIGMLIADYFAFPQSGKTFFLRDHVLTLVPFEKRIQIWEGIANYEKLLNAEQKKGIESADEVRRIRNDVAHKVASYHPVEKKYTVIRQKMKWNEDGWPESKITKVDEELVGKVMEKTNTASLAVNNLSFELYKMQKDGRAH